MDRFNKLSGSVKALFTVALALFLTGALVLLAAEKTAAKGEQGFLGVSVRALDDDELQELGVQHGVRVEAVEKESAAGKAGILEDDVILAVDGEKVRSPLTLTEIVRERTPGTAVKIAIQRQGKAQEVKAVLGKLERPKHLVWKSAPMLKHAAAAPYLGVSILDADGDLASYFGVKAGEGVLVTGVVKDTAAEKAGFKAGDVIVAMGDKPVQKTNDVHNALAGLEKGATVTVTVVRRGKRETLKAAPDFDRQRRVIRIFKGGKDMELGHLELPELDIEIPEPPELDVEVPEPPDAEEIASRVRENLARTHECLERAREKLGEVRVRVLKKIQEAGAGTMI
jgi:membrane-associated protease RseP (regulator of RpoE activity)